VCALRAHSYLNPLQPSSGVPDETKSIWCTASGWDALLWPRRGTVMRRLGIAADHGSFFPHSTGMRWLVLILGLAVPTRCADSSEDSIAESR
jgi:hypothetical protein